ncbi:MAG TPA: glucose 1-dehydrogenase [Bacteroidales bacterium]|nr:glucose 1-dehydrogenase [Bacteroidales bacterium]
MKSLTGKTVLVTGGATGIGKSIVEKMAAEGANVVINYITHEKESAELVDQINANKGKAKRFKADISNEKQVEEMYAFIEKEFGVLDVLVNNAGMQKDKEFLKMELDDWHKVTSVDLAGHFLCSREAGKAFMKKDIKKDESTRGVIIFITSVHQIIPWSGHANYTAAKGGAAMLMKTIAQELAPNHIRVNAVAPGAVRTPINEENFEDEKKKQQILRKIPFDRPGKPEEIASAVAFLASDEASYITGTTLYVDGGMTLYADFAHGG